MKTPSWNFGLYISVDSNFPEVARCFALNGVAVLIRVNQAPRGAMEEAEMITMRNRLRAYENNCYLVTSAWAASPLTEYGCGTGHSMIIDYRGKIMVESLDTIEGYVHSIIDVNALRGIRKKFNPWNFLMEFRAEVYAAVFSRKSCFPPNLYLDPDKNMQSLEEKSVVYRNATENLKKQGIMD